MTMYERSSEQARSHANSRRLNSYKKVLEHDGLISSGSGVRWEGWEIEFNIPHPAMMAQKLVDRFREVVHGPMGAVPILLQPGFLNPPRV